MNNFAATLVLLGMLNLHTTAQADSPDFSKQLDFECGSDKICRTALIEQRDREEAEDIDLLMLEEKIIAEAGGLKDEVKPGSDGERKPQAIVKRPPRPSGPRP